MAARREMLILNREIYDSRRAAKGLSIERMARLADVSMSTAMAVHRGATVGPESRRRLAAALEVAESDLWLRYGEVSRVHG